MEYIDILMSSVLNRFSAYEKGRAAKNWAIHKETRFQLVFQVFTLDQRLAVEYTSTQLSCTSVLSWVG